MHQGGRTVCGIETTRLQSIAKIVPAVNWMLGLFVLFNILNNFCNESAFEIDLLVGCAISAWSAISGMALTLPIGWGVLCFGSAWNDCVCREETVFIFTRSVVLSSDKCHDGKFRSCAVWQRCEANSATPKFVKFEILEIPQSCKITERFNIQDMNFAIAQFHQSLTLEIA